MIGGRWAVVTLDRPQGGVVDVIGKWSTYDEAEHELKTMRADSPSPKLLGLATCALCLSSDAGCERCNPE